MQMFCMLNAKEERENVARDWPSHYRMPLYFEYLLKLERLLRDCLQSRSEIYVVESVFGIYSYMYVL